MYKRFDYNPTTSITKTYQNDNENVPCRRNIVSVICFECVIVLS